MNYYYVISAHYTDFYSILYEDIKKTDYAIFKDYDYLSRLGWRFACLVWRLQCFKIVKPLVRLIESLYFKYYFGKLSAGIPHNIDKYCFMLPSCVIGIGADEYIRNNYPGSKIVCFCTDLLAIHYWDMYLLENPEKADVFYTYDGGEAEKYGMNFLNLPCSDLTHYIAGIQEKYDLSFVGQDKGRLSDLIHICENLKSRGLTCNFHLVKVPKEKQIVIDGMHYHDDYMSFVDCLKISASARCILELIQPGSKGNTTRVAESISIGRKLLSVNPNLVNNEYYIPENMLCFNTIEDVPDDFFMTDYNEISEETRNRIRPETFIKHIEHDLNDIDNLTRAKS